jgi:hypothetical protein
MSGSESIWDEHKHSFKSSNICCWDYPHENFSLPPPLVIWLRAHAIWENPNTNLWQKLARPKKLLKLSEFGWGWLVANDLDLGWIHMYTMLINDVA